MKDRHERFNQAFNTWRGGLASTEEAYIKTADLVGNFIHSFGTLKELEDVLSNRNHSEAYTQLNQYQKRSMGAILYCRMSIDDAVKILPDSAEEKETLRVLRDILTSFYDNPNSMGKKELNLLFSNANKLLDMEVNDLANPKLARELFFDIYGMLGIFNDSIDSLNRLIKIAIDANERKKDIRLLLKKITDKVGQLDTLIQQQNASDLLPKEEKTIQEHINDRILTLLSGETSEEKQLAHSKACWDEISEDLTKIIALREEQAKKGDQIKQIEAFLKDVEENDKKVTGRLYFSDLKKAHETAFQLLLEVAADSQSEQKLTQDLRVQEEQSLTPEALYVASTLSLPATVLWRKFAPQFFQNTVNACVPDTMDSQCKNDLKRLAEEQLAQLGAQEQQIKSDLDRITEHLAQDNQQLKTLIKKTSAVNLRQIMAEELVIGKYAKIIHFVKQNRNKLMECQSKNNSLARFIQEQNGLGVKLSNSLSKISTIPKSDTLKMIDKARETQKELQDQIDCYKFFIGRDLKILNAIVLSEGIKAKLDKELAELDSVKIKPLHLTKQNFQSELDKLEPTKYDALFSIREEFEAVDENNNPSLSF